MRRRPNLGGLWRPIALALVSIAALPAVASAATVYVTRTSDNMVSQFHIGAGGALEPLDPAAVAAGAKPTGVVASPNGNSVYVAEAGTGATVGNDHILQYDINQTTGALGAKTPFMVTAAGDNTIGQLAVSADSASVYATGYNTGSTQGGLFQFDAGAGGLLAPKSPSFIGVAAPTHDRWSSTRPASACTSPTAPAASGGTRSASAAC